LDENNDHHQADCDPGKLTSKSEANRIEANKSFQQKNHGFKLDSLRMQLNNF
jgi:hypothetical protein